MKNVIPIERAYKYKLVTYLPKENGFGLEAVGELDVNFVRSASEGKEAIEGISVEQLIYLAIDRLKTINYDRQDRNTSQSILSLTEAVEFLNKRKREWKQRSAEYSDKAE